MTVQSLHHSDNFIQSFKFSVFHPTIPKPRGQGAIFTCDCSNLLKTCFCCCRTRKLPHVQACWGIHEQSRVFYWVKAFLHLQIDAFAFPYLFFYWSFWWTSSWLTIIQKLGSDNQQKRSCWPGKFFETWQNIIKKSVLNANTIRSPCWKLFAMPMTS